MFRFFAKLKDWVISVSFPSFPDVKTPSQNVSFFPWVLEAFEYANLKKSDRTGDLGSFLSKTRDARTFIERASMYCADYPYLIKNLEAGLGAGALLCIFLSEKRSFVESHFKIVCTPPPKQKKVKTKAGKILGIVERWRVLRMSDEERTWGFFTSSGVYRGFERKR